MDKRMMRRILLAAMIEEDEKKKIKDQWQEQYDETNEYGIDPQDYDTEEDYARVVRKARYRWREKYKWNFESETDPEQYETEEDYLLAREEELNSEEW